MNVVYLINLVPEKVICYRIRKGGACPWLSRAASNTSTFYFLGILMLLIFF